MSAPARVHGPECPCVRCSGFTPGHQLSVRHGAYSNGIALKDRAEEMAEQIRADMPHYAPADEGMVRLLALTEARLERAVTALDGADDALASELSGYRPGEAGDMLERLRTDFARWIRLARGLRNDLALGTAARGRLGLDVALARRAADQGLAEYVAERYGDGNGGTS